MNQQQLVSCLGLAGIVMVVVAQPVRADTVKVTAIELKPTSQGIEIVLRTADSKVKQVFTSGGNTFVANVLNTQLQLPSGNTFRQQNPIEGIAAVTVNEVGTNSIRIVVTGETQLPRGIVTQDETDTDRLGIYLQDQISIFDNLKLLAGLRYDTVDQDTVNIPGAFVESGEVNRNYDALTPRVGIVYQPIEEVSLYASYSQSFNPNSANTASGDPLEPEKGEGYEFGIKGELLDQLFATLAY